MQTLKRKDKSDIKNKCNTICRESSEQDKPNKNPKSKRKSVITLVRRQYDQTHKQMGNSENTKTRVQSFCENFPRSMTDYMKTSIRAKPNHFKFHVGTNDLNLNRPPDEVAKTIIDLASEL